MKMRILRSMCCLIGENMINIWLGTKLQSGVQVFSPDLKRNVLFWQRKKKSPTVCIPFCGLFFFPFILSKTKVGVKMKRTHQIFVWIKLFKTLDRLKSIQTIASLCLCFCLDSYTNLNILFCFTWKKIVFDEFRIKWQNSICITYCFFFIIQNEIIYNKSCLHQINSRKSLHQIFGNKYVWCREKCIKVTKNTILHRMHKWCFQVYSSGAGVGAPPAGAL